jgi:AcrR family transcriptional regulator
MSGHLATPRQRLLDAMADSIAHVGYQQTTVGDIVAHAQTSRRTFYQYFADREDCLVALLRCTHLNAIRAISSGINRSSPWNQQIRQAIESWMAYAETQSPVILSWIVQTPALGPQAQKFRNEVNDAYIDLIQSVSSNAALRAAGFDTVPRARAIIFIGGLRELVTLTWKKGEKLSDVTEDACNAAIALFAPQPDLNPVESTDGSTAEDLNRIQGYGH